MRIWRLCRRKDVDAAFDGEGARRHGGRWNRPGTRVVYTSSTLSLAVLENLVHFDLEDPPEGELYAFPIEIPEDVEVASIDVNTLPDGWDTYPGPDGLKDIGTKWASSGRTAVLAVPSAVVPELNYVLNPKHPDFQKLVITLPQAFNFDARLFP